MGEDATVTIPEAPEQPFWKTYDRMEKAAKGELTAYQAHEDEQPVNSFVFTGVDEPAPEPVDNVTFKAITKDQAAAVIAEMDTRSGTDGFANGPDEDRE